MPGRVFKRGETYHIAFSYQGVEYRKSALTDKKRDAEQVLAFYLGQCARGTFTGFDAAPASYTVFEMLDEYQQDFARRGMRSVDIVGYYISTLKTYFGNIPVTDLTERAIDRYITHRLTTMSLKTRRPISRTTVNRETQVLGSAMRLAKRKKLLLTELPYIEHFSEKGNARQGFFEREECDRICQCLPPHLQDVLRFAYCVGWRKGEILSLRWEYIQGDWIRLPPERDKSKEGRVVPILGELAAILARRAEERVVDCPYVFHYRGTQIKYLKRTWRIAREKAGLPHKLFHDTRRTVARNLDRAGVPRQVAKALIGHKTESMYNRYRIVNEADLREGMARYVGHQTDTQ